MALVDELTKLHALQKVDAQIYQREQALKALDNGDKLKAEAIAILKQHDAAKAALQKAEAAQRNKELELRGLEDKRKVVSDKLYGGRVTNPKELGDLQKDEEMIAAQVGRVEEDVLELMETTETARATEATLAQQLAVAKRRWQETVTRFQAETARLQQEIAALRPEREACAAAVDKPLLRRYDDIRQRREGVGMAVTGNDTCPACNMRLNPRTLNLLRAGEEIAACDSCDRILLWLS